jgi:hypothetical protein
MQGKDKANQVEVGSGSGGVVAFVVLISKATHHAHLTVICTLQFSRVLRQNSTIQVR